ncbi:MAG: hypothetical protein R3B99_18975 [Polyangiales bacterium]
MLDGVACMNEPVSRQTAAVRTLTVTVTLSSTVATTAPTSPARRRTGLPRGAAVRIEDGRLEILADVVYFAPTAT